MSESHENASAPETGAQRNARSAQRDSAWQSIQQRFDPRVKSPGFAAFLSIAPGLGQVYIGYYVRGASFAFSVVALFLAADAVVSSIEGLFIFAGLFTWAFNIIDAGRMAALYNHAMAGADSIEMPEDFRMPSMGGSIGGGIVLLVLGSIALSNTALGWSLEWLDQWWPVLPMAMGAWLLYAGMKERNG